MVDPVPKLRGAHPPLALGHADFGERARQFGAGRPGEDDGRARQIGSGGGGHGGASSTVEAGEERSKLRAERVFSARPAPALPRRATARRRRSAAGEGGEAPRARSTSPRRQRPWRIRLAASATAPRAGGAAGQQRLRSSPASQARGAGAALSRGAGSPASRPRARSAPRRLRPLRSFPPPRTALDRQTRAAPASNSRRKSRRSAAAADRARRRRNRARRGARVARPARRRSAPPPRR